MSQRVQPDKNLDTSAAHFDQKFDQKLIPQQCHAIIKFEIISTVNPIESMNTCSKSPGTLFMKEIFNIISNSIHRCRKLNNYC